MLSKRKPKNSAKNLSAIFQVEIDSLVNKLEYMNNKRSSKPSTQCTWALQALATNGILIFLSLLAFQISQYYQIASAKPHRLLLENPLSFPSSKTLSILWKVVGCVWVQISSQGMTMREEKEKWLQWFLIKGWVALSLSLKDGCVVL